MITQLQLINIIIIIIIIIIIMFRTDLLSVIRILNTVYTAIGISNASYVDLTSLADSQPN